jgi:hypothetical protein
MQLVQHAIPVSIPGERPRGPCRGLAEGSLQLLVSHNSVAVQIQARKGTAGAAAAQPALLLSVHHRQHPHHRPEALRLQEEGAVDGARQVRLRRRVCG